MRRNVRNHAGFLATTDSAGTGFFVLHINGSGNTYGSDIIESTYRHNIVTCTCGCCSVDGGVDFLKRGFTHSKDDFTELSILLDREKVFDIIQSCTGSDRALCLILSIGLFFGDSGAIHERSLGLQLTPLNSLAP